MKDQAGTPHNARNNKGGSDLRPGAKGRTGGRGKQVGGTHITAAKSLTTRLMGSCYGIIQRDYIMELYYGIIVWGDMEEVY